MNLWESPGRNHCSRLFWGYSFLRIWEELFCLPALFFPLLHLSLAEPFGDAEAHTFLQRHESTFFTPQMREQ